MFPYPPEVESARCTRLLDPDERASLVKTSDRWADAGFTMAGNYDLGGQGVLEDEYENEADVGKVDITSSSSSSSAASGCASASGTAVGSVRGAGCKRGNAKELTRLNALLGGIAVRGGDGVKLARTCGQITDHNVAVTRGLSRENIRR